jgi:excinuclease ABC subunit C
LVRDIADIEWIVVGSELEALILEMNLIKKHRPKYNIRLKDDKRYPYIKIHWNEPFPKVTVTRQMEEDGSRYFGPYTSAWAVYQTLEVLRKIFPYLTCDREITGQDKRALPLLRHQALYCAVHWSYFKSGYRQMISDLMEFLSGHSEPRSSRGCKLEMQKASDEMRFEKAAALRDQLKAMQSIIERQKDRLRHRLRGLGCDRDGP